MKDKNNLDGNIIFESNGRTKTIEKKNPVGRPVKFAAPNLSVFSLTQPEAISQITTDPEMLNTQLVIRNQIRPDENTIIWGADDAEPIRILDAIAQSPTTTNCVGKVEMFTRGSAFTDTGLMEMVINEDGETLWDLHCAICQYYSQLDAFTVNFKYDQKGRIINSYNVSTDSCRFAAEVETHKICGIKYNPYFGTSEYQMRYTDRYELFKPENVLNEIKTYKDPSEYLGQIYFHGTKRTLYKHYPVPKFWSGKKWIYSDAKFATYIEKLLDNGFFESVLMKLIGNPDELSQHPDAMKLVTGDDGIERKESYKTVGQMFNETMAKNFSGVEKAAKVMALWSLNKDQSVSLEAFPTSVNDQLISTALLETIRMVAISTDVPAILANLPNSLSSLASGGDAIKSAVEYLQSGTASRRNTLEKFYNTVMLPNLQKPPKQEVKIKPFSPFNIMVTVDDKFWEFMNESEKIDFIQKNEPNITLNRTPAATSNTAPPTLDENGKVVTPAPTAPTVDENLKSMKVSEINRILSIVKKFNLGTLTIEQAKQLLAGYGLNEEQQTAWLNPTLE